MTFNQEPIDSPQAWVAEHVHRYIATNGEDGHLWRGAPTLILTTLGRRSGKSRRLALIYGRHGEHYVVVASKGGAPQHPDWYRNILDHPEVHVQVMADTFTAKARTATPVERKALWPQMTQIWPDYTTYQEKTDREIPLVILERV